MSEESGQSVERIPGYASGSLDQPNNIPMKAPKPAIFSSSDAESLEGDAADREDASIQSRWAVKGSQKRYFGFLRSRSFYVVLVMGQILSLCITCTNTMTTLINTAGTSFPLFQNLLNYALLAIVYVPYTFYRYGWRKFLKLLVLDSWRYFILAFADVEGNYCVVLAYEFTNILSAALLDNFAIVVVVILSFILLKVRYHWSQYLGVIVSVGGMALLIVSDHLTGKDYRAVNPVKGDLLVLLGAACYGISNTFEEFLVSKRPMYEVLAMMGFWGSGINGVQLAIFERSTLKDAIWTPDVGGYLIGYVLTMFLLYHLAPLTFRMSSAAFYNLSLLTSDFWSLIVGTAAFGYTVYWLYPVGFVCVVIGVVCYCAAPMTSFGEGMKPWLGENQEAGVDGFGTVKRQLRRNQDDAQRRETESGGSDSDIIEETTDPDTEQEGEDIREF